MEYYSEKEGFRPTPACIISNNVWRGLVSIIEEAIRNDALSKDFPEQCPDGNGVCGFNPRLFRDLLTAIVPGMDYPFPNISYDDSVQTDPFESEEERRERLIIEQNSVLDTIEFVYCHLHDVFKDPHRYHEFFHHFELVFVEGNKCRVSFRESVNEVFRRNGVQYLLNEDGHITRLFSPTLTALLNRDLEVTDQTVKDLFYNAVDKYRNPKFEEQRIGLERLWDSFERLKTVYRPSLDKKDSASLLIKDASKGNVSFEQILLQECKVLTNLGNHFQIRHHEVNKVPIDNPVMVDYLFTRMLSLLNPLLHCFSREA